jgi:hypothetical protein
MHHSIHHKARKCGGDDKYTTHLFVLSHIIDTNLIFVSFRNVKKPKDRNKPTDQQAVVEALFGDLANTNGAT